MRGKMEEEKQDEFSTLASRPPVRQKWTTRVPRFIK
jgi:hypothetical protein